MTLRKKIFNGYGVAIVLMICVIAWAIANLVSLGKATHSILQENYRSIVAAEHMNTALERQNSASLAILCGNPRDGMALFRENDIGFLEWLTRARDNITITGEAALLESIQTMYVRYRQQFFEMANRTQAGTVQLVQFAGYYRQAFTPQFAALHDKCLALRNMNEREMLAASARAARIAGSAIWSTLVISIVAFLAAFVFSLFLANHLVSPLRNFIEGAGRISEGDYSVNIRVDTKDELRQLAAEFNSMTARLKAYNELNVAKIILEKNKSEAILSSIDDGMIVVEKDLSITGINPAAMKIFAMGFANHERGFLTDIRPLAHLCEIVRTAFETRMIPEVPEDRKSVCLSHDGKDEHYLVSITMIHGKDEDLSGIVLLFRDVTHLKEMEHLKSEFVMAASHELRTPITSIGMSVDLLIEHASPSLTPEHRELLESAHEEIQRMQNLVNDLLDLSRIESGKMEVVSERTSVNTLFEHIHRIFRTQLESKQVGFEISSSDPELEIHADPNKISWVISNLVSNALRYVNHNGHIRLNAKKGNDHVYLSVTDDGPGIPFEYHKKIFDKFIQIEGRISGGSGLGLAICKEIVRAHHGTIWVESSPGHGSTFTFTIPAPD